MFCATLKFHFFFQISSFVNRPQIYIAELLYLHQMHWNVYDADVDLVCWERLLTWVWVVSWDALWRVSPLWYHHLIICYRTKRIIVFEHDHDGRYYLCYASLKRRRNSKWIQQIGFIQVTTKNNLDWLINFTNKPTKQWKKKMCKQFIGYWKMVQISVIQGVVETFIWQTSEKFLKQKMAKQ